MIITAYSERGFYSSGERKKECQDKILLGDTILSDGFYKNDNIILPAIVAVADGIGGYDGGELAAYMTVDALRQLEKTGSYYSNSYESDNSIQISRQDVRDAVYNVNDAIVDFAEENESFANMGTTLTGMCLYEDEGITFHIGNTRISCMCDEEQGVPEVYALTEDQVDYYDESGNRPLTGCLGVGDRECVKEYLTVKKCSLFDNAKLYFITSDGVHDYVENDIFAAFVEKNMESDNWEELVVKEIAAHARMNGSKDDISIILIHR